MSPSGVIDPSIDKLVPFSIIAAPFGRSSNGIPPDGAAAERDPTHLQTVAHEYQRPVSAASAIGPPTLGTRGAATEPERRA